MKTYYVVIVGGLVIIVGMLLFPSFQLAIDAVDTTGWLSVTKMAAAFFPYALLLFVVYWIVKLARR